jgi:bifunctional UDP-N-acetylglucosamine pyrophosphorylase/glucosamine-1-phosphate N-acetyltransferase
MFVRQEPQLGTGHAVQQAVPELPDDGMVVVLSGDVPLIEAATLRALITDCAGQRLALLTVDMPDPTGYGRIVRGHARWAGASRRRPGAGHRRAQGRQRGRAPDPRGLQRHHGGAPALLKGWLARLDNRNAQGEYYLTDIVKFAVADGVPKWWRTKITDKPRWRRQQPLAAGRTGARCTSCARRAR